MSTDPEDVPGTGNLRLGINNLCPETVGCSGDASPPNPGLVPYEVYVCHPPPGQNNCDGVRHLSSSWLPPTEVQHWLVEAKYPGELTRITFVWFPQALPDDLSMHIIIEGGDLIDMKNPLPPQEVPRTFEILMVTKVTTNFVICSRALGVALDRCLE